MRSHNNKNYVDASTKNECMTRRAVFQGEKSTGTEAAATRRREKEREREKKIEKEKLSHLIMFTRTLGTRERSKKKLVAMREHIRPTGEWMPRIISIIFYWAQT